MEAIWIYLPGILLSYTAFFLAIASPGPNVLAVIGTSMGVGRTPGIALGMGVAAGSLCWALLTAMGLSALLAAYAWALNVIKTIGGIYLLWLAYKAIRSSVSAHDIHATTLENAPHSLFGYAARGFVINMTNPKAVLAWIAIISLGLHDDAPFWVGFSIVFGTSLLSLIIHLVYAVAFSTPFMMRFYSKARRWIQATLGIFFAAAGIKMLFGRT